MSAASLPQAAPAVSYANSPCQTCGRNSMSSPSAERAPLRGLLLLAALAAAVFVAALLNRQLRDQCEPRARRPRRCGR